MGSIGLKDRVRWDIARGIGVREDNICVPLNSVLLNSPPNRLGSILETSRKTWECPEICWRLLEALLGFWSSRWIPSKHVSKRISQHDPN